MTKRTRNDILELIIGIALLVVCLVNYNASLITKSLFYTMTDFMGVIGIVFIFENGFALWIKLSRYERTLSRRGR